MRDARMVSFFNRKVLIAKSEVLFNFVAYTGYIIMDKLFSDETIS